MLKMEVARFVHGDGLDDVCCGLAIFDVPEKSRYQRRMEKSLVLGRYCSSHCCADFVRDPGESGP